MKLTTLARAGLGLVFCFSLGTAHAVWTASVDLLQIDQNGSTVWNDDFSTDTSTAYNTNFPFTVSGGKGLMNSQDGAFGLSGISGGERWFSRARQGTWLYNTDLFMVSSVFDIVTPDARGRYGMRLVDTCGTCGNDDVADMSLRFNAAGDAQISYRYNGDPRNPNIANGFDIDQSTGTLDISAFSQVAFFMQNTGDGNVMGGYLFLDGSTPFDLTTMFSSISWFSMGYNIFNTELRVRTELINVEVPTAVSEPATILMLLSGLLAIGVVSRRKDTC